MAGQTIDFTQTGVLGELTFDTFGCNVFKADNLPTPDRLQPDIFFERGVRFGMMLPTPDGKTIEVWRFEDELNRREVWPSPPIRCRVGQIVHSKIYARNNTHTIHHHGIEPTTFNDGVGHVSFEVGDTYTYQFQPSTPGTYFYHCHKNTVLHFEMGMYGFLIVDPPEGPGYLYSGGPRYDVEMAWAVDDLDPKWRQLGHSAGLCGEDAGLNVFRPKYFVINGVFAPNTMYDPRVSMRVARGKTGLIRLLNCSYSVLSVTLGIDVECVAYDGHGMGSRNNPWCRAFKIRAGTPIELTSAQRVDLLVKPTRQGVYPVRMEFRDWITGEIQDGGNGVAETQIVVT
jgi:FtsP/CotA-like multicopper oxidase with cupredoxin domain